MDQTNKKARSAKQASYELAKATLSQRHDALERIAQALDEGREGIISANQKDLDSAREKISDALYQRLKFDSKKIDGVIKGIDSLIDLADPIGRTISAKELSDDLELFQVSCPIGVIGCVFESRPDALVQISSLCMKSGNSVILKGGSEAQNTNKILYDIISEASIGDGIPEGWIHLVQSRQEVSELLSCDQYIDLMIPRGSNDFVRYIQDNTRIAVLGHSSGVCHVYVDADCDIDKAVRVVFDAKCQYPAVCNAMETLIVNSNIADEFLPIIFKLFDKEGVKAKGDVRACEIISQMEAAQDEDWYDEYNDLILNVKVLDSTKQACEWINEHGSHHTDSIVTEDYDAAKYFMNTVDSASVMWNASTRFSDGFRYGLGAEVGISTNKIHARGPVGTDGLTIYKWILKGDGHTVSDFSNKEFTHRALDKEWV